MNSREGIIIALILMTSFIFFFCGGSLATLSHEFNGSETFNTLSEAYTYQNKIITEANSENASVDWATVNIVNNKIKVNWQVMMGGNGFDSEPFLYGERKMSPTYTLTSFIILLSMPILMIIILLIKWHRDDKKNKISTKSEIKEE